MADQPNVDELLRSLIRDVPDFPKKGIIFKDITPVLSDVAGFRAVQAAFVERYRTMQLDAVAGIDSRGFIFGAPLALELGVPFVPIRKAGKLPWHAESQEYALEYGTATIEIHRDAVRPGQRVLVMDDLLATGGTAAAGVSLVERLGGTVVEAAFVIELGFLGGSARVGAPCHSLVQY